MYLLMDLVRTKKGKEGIKYKVKPYLFRFVRTDFLPRMPKEENDDEEDEWIYTENEEVFENFEEASTAYRQREENLKKLGVFDPDTISWGTSDYLGWDVESSARSRGKKTLEQFTRDYRNEISIGETGIVIDIPELGIIDGHKSCNNKQYWLLTLYIPDMETCITLSVRECVELYELHNTYKEDEYNKYYNKIVDKYLEDLYVRYLMFEGPDYVPKEEKKIFSCKNIIIPATEVAMEERTNYDNRRVY